MESQIVETVNRRIDDLAKRIDSMDSKLDELLKFKWQIIGGSVFLSSLFAICFQIILAAASK